MSSSSFIRNEDLLALQSYVTANDSTQYSNLAQDTVVLDLTHSNLKQRHAEIRFDLHDTIDTLRSKIHQKTGTPPGCQRLEVMSGGRVSVVIEPGRDGERMLGYFGLTHGMTVHCVDLDPNSGSRGGQYEDTTLVAKYKMSDEEYDKRRGTLREWERERKSRDPNFSLAKHAREHRELMDAQRQAKLGLPLPAGFELDGSGKVVRVEEEEEVTTVGSISNGTDENGKEIPGVESVSGIEVGMRCEVSPGGRRGVVAFVGEVSEIGGGGYWVGVTFDEPVGKTDGTTRSGRRYFEAPAQNRGGFVRGKNVQVGDFPERDIFDELESDSEDEL